MTRNITSNVVFIARGGTDLRTQKVLFESIHQNKITVSQLCHECIEGGTADDLPEYEWRWRAGWAESKSRR